MVFRTIVPIILYEVHAPLEDTKTHEQPLDSSLALIYRSPPPNSLCFRHRDEGGVPLLRLEYRGTLALFKRSNLTVY